MVERKDQNHAMGTPVSRPWLHGGPCARRFAGSGGAVKPENPAHVNGVVKDMSWRTASDVSPGTRWHRGRQRCLRCQTQCSSRCMRPSAWDLDIIPMLLLLSWNRCEARASSAFRVLRRGHSARKKTPGRHYSEPLISRSLVVQRSPSRGLAGASGESGAVPALDAPPSDSSTRRRRSIR